MEGNRTMAIEEPSKMRIWLDNQSFDFAKKLKVGDKGIMNIEGFISLEKQDSEKGIIKTLKFSKIKLVNNARSI